MKKSQIVSLIFISLILFVSLIAYIALPNFFFKRGLNHFNNDDFIGAYKYFTNARLWNKTNADYRYYYVQTLAKFKPTLKIQTEMFEFAESEKKDSAQTFASIQVNLWRNNAMHTYGDNYIDQAPMNGEIIRWDPRTFPLKVYISSTYDSTYPDYYSTETTKAFGQWAASSGFMAFNFIDNPHKANIVVNFKPSPSTDCSAQGCKYIVAHTVPVIKNRILKQMIITVYDKDATGSFFSDKELYKTVLHEIGHSLGIIGHSYSTDDLMYMSTEGKSVNNSVFTKHRSDFQYISPKDINTLRLLYNLTPTISNVPASNINSTNLLYPPIILGNMKIRGERKLKEAKSYIENAPDLPNGYIDLAIAYDDLGNSTKALDAFQTAFNLSRSDEDKFIVLYNISAMYLKINKPELAMEYAMKAQEIDPSDDVAELISNIEHSMKTKMKPFWINRK